ncbi:hypothetical protein Lfu02_49400 [Longispora fulva]|nr:hypothetical protein Lfu02_49400 [Longispora fulva]
MASSPRSQPIIPIVCQHGQRQRFVTIRPDDSPLTGSLWGNELAADSAHHKTECDPTKVAVPELAQQPRG